MSTTEVLIIVLLAVAATAIATSYITLIIVGWVERKMILKYLGEDDEYMESDDGEKADREDGQRNKEGFLRYKCKRDKGSWLLSLSPPVPDRKASKDPKVSEKELPVSRKKQRP